MKKNIYIKAIFLLISFGISVVNLHAQTSGWEDKGEYREQKLRIINLYAMTVSPDNTIFYTLHDNRIVYYWDISTGSLLDSLIIPEKNVYCFFAKDGNSVIYTYPGETLQIGAKSKLVILDLSSKEQICKSIVSVPGNIPYNPPITDTYNYYLHDEGNIRFTLIDFNSATNQLYCGFSFDYENTLISITAETSTTKGFGGSAIFDVKPDTIIPIKKLSLFPTTDFLLVDTLAFFTDFKYTFENGRIYRLYRFYSVAKEWATYFKNINQDTSIIVKKNSYQRKYEWSETSGEKESNNGNDIPLSKLFYNKSKNRVFVKADSLYYIISLKNTPTVIDTLFLRKNATCEYFDDNKGKFLYVSKNSIVVQDIYDKADIKTIICPFPPQNMSILPNGTDLLISDINGKVVLFENYSSHYQPLSGWKNIGNGKEEILRMDNLNSIKVSSDSKTLYSLHDNRTVWYWDAITGVRYDSLNIDSASTATFSKDGRTLCVYKKMPDDDKSYTTTTITIYDLSNKKVISKSAFGFPGSITCDLPTLSGPKVANRRFTTLDYDYPSGKLTCAIAFQYDYVRGTKEIRRSSYTLGGAATFRVYPDTLEKDAQISSIMPFNVINSGKYAYSTLLSSRYEKMIRGATDSSYTECKFILRKTDLSAGESYELIDNSYEKNDKYSNGTHEINEILGEFKPLTNLFYIRKTETLLAREENSYYAIDVNKYTLLDTLSLLPGANLETLNRDSTGLYYAVDNIIYLLNFNNKEIIDTIKCDFTPCAISIAADGVIIAGEKGEILLFKEKPKSVFEPDKFPSLTINPNPASDLLFLQADNELIGARVEIFTQTGEKVIDTAYSERIDISSLHAGVYFLRAGGRIGKFVKQ